MKKIIPNTLTIIRILIIPLLVYLCLQNHFFTLIIISIIIFSTDVLDGYLARKWQVVSKLGDKLDILADKLLGLAMLILLVIKIDGFFFLFILECILSTLILYIFLKKHLLISLFICKIKTCFLFSTIILGFLTIVFPNIMFLTKIIVIITCILEIISFLSILIYAITRKYEADYQEFYQIIKPFIEHKEFIKRKDYPHHINESVYAHTLRVSYDCFKIAKAMKLDYKSLAIAGLLHDFYEKPWQYDNEKKPFLQMHAFTHAENAVLNAKKIYGKKITPKISNMMMTHMFPVNKRIPKSKEAWLLTLVDKADSMDFIMHPIKLYQIFKNNPKKNN